MKAVRSDVWRNCCRVSTARSRSSESGLGDHWRDTAIVVATEFGRTAHINGTEGTDHGTGTIALLAGGAVKGGRVISNWPGLKPADLYQNRDLAPTTDLRAVIKGVLQDHLGIERARAGADGVSGQRSGQADEGAGCVVCCAANVQHRCRPGLVRNCARGPGPITTAVNCFACCRLLRSFPPQASRRTGPGLRRDDIGGHIVILSISAISPQSAPCVASRKWRHSLPELQEAIECISP